ncbi:MAG: winged helix-turn-helix transcriptional regulator [Alphaproteobacteria bacterium]|nr:winged helix-turn-helix transcriptional regulator [Alphaproteobacteria bacterium SS10]
MTDDQALDAAFAALANPTRRAILARLAEGTATVNELAAPFSMSLPAVSKHIKVLEAAGLISQAREAQFRPCNLETEQLKAVASWTDQYRHIWDARLQKMDLLLSEMKDKTS